MIFKKAERKRAKLKVAISGPSGAGKTYSALLMASGMGGKIAVIDTENDSASLYADKFEFDTVCLEAPFTTDKYLAAMKAAEKAGYDILIIDSATHQWDGEGGISDRKSQVDARGGNSYTNWAKFSPEHNKFLSAIVQHPTHLICTVRSKQEYALEKNDKGKMAPQKVGLAPVQRAGFEFEFSLMLDVAMDHSAIASKDRTGLFDGKTFIPTMETGAQLIEWVNSAKPDQSLLIASEFKKIKALRTELGITVDEMKAELHKEFKVDDPRLLDLEQLQKFNLILQTALEAKIIGSTINKELEVPADGQPNFAAFR
jgi:hypothetical protein